MEKETNITETATEELETQETTQATSAEEESTAEKETASITQEELNEIIAKRIERERKKYADYDELKARVEEQERAAEQAKREKMTEVERLQADLAEKEAELTRNREQAEQARKDAEELRIRTAFEAQARKAGIAYVSDAYALAVEGKGVVKYVDGEIVGVDDVIKDIVENKPYLLTKAKPIGQPMGQTQELPSASKADVLEQARKTALRTGRPEDRIKYAKLKRELGK